jgi:hypothetical protein
VSCQPRKMSSDRVTLDHMSTEPSTIFQAADCITLQHCREARVVSKLLRQTARKTGGRPARLAPRSCPSESRRADCATSVSLRVQPLSAGSCRKSRLLLVYLSRLPFTIARYIYATALYSSRRSASDEPIFDITYALCRLYAALTIGV